MFKSIFAAGLLGAALFLASAAEASYVMAGSNYEVRHQSLVLQSLQEKCGFYGDVEVMSSTVEDIRIDQGIVDRKFTTVLRYKQRLDQMIFDTYEANVVSYLYDHYDHSTGNWGAYSVESVSCTML